MKSFISGKSFQSYFVIKPSDRIVKNGVHKLTPCLSTGSSSNDVFQDHVPSDDKRPELADAHVTVDVSRSSLWHSCGKLRETYSWNERSWRCMKLSFSFSWSFKINFLIRHFVARCFWLIVKVVKNKTTKQTATTNGDCK